MLIYYYFQCIDKHLLHTDFLIRKSKLIFFLIHKVFLFNSSTSIKSMLVLMIFQIKKKIQIQNKNVYNVSTLFCNCCNPKKETKWNINETL